MSDYSYRVTVDCRVYDAKHRFLLHQWQNTYVCHSPEELRSLFVRYEREENPNDEGLIVWRVRNSEIIFEED